MNRNRNVESMTVHSDGVFWSLDETIKCIPGLGVEPKSWG